MRISDWSSDVCSSDLAFARKAVQSSDGRADDPVRRARLPVELDQHGYGIWRRTVGKLSQGEVAARLPRPPICMGRSEEHTSELQSLMRISYAVFCLKKKII